MHGFLERGNRFHLEQAGVNQGLKALLFSIDLGHDSWRGKQLSQNRGLLQPWMVEQRR
ncbi:hypothetical protein CKA32_005016 [Geitlerinema sp. FC II]|nr:hypothetical protein CKA32_005016 [Geitlerinema sp. FC II]